MDGSHEGIAMSVFCCRTAKESCLTQVQWEMNIYNPFKTPGSAETVSAVLWVVFNVRYLAGHSHTACNTLYIDKHPASKHKKTKKESGGLLRLTNFPSSELQVRIQDQTVGFKPSARHPEPPGSFACPACTCTRWAGLPNVTQTPAACDRPSQSSTKGEVFY